MLETVFMLVLVAACLAVGWFALFAAQKLYKGESK